MEAVELQGAVTDSNVLFTATVRNNGTAASTNLRADVSCGGESAPLIGQFGYPTSEFGSVAPGETVTVEFPLTNFLTGTVPCYLSVDPAGAQAETDETNNVFGPLPVTIPEFNLTPLPDIIVLSVEPSVEADGSMKVPVTIYNGGNETVSDFKVQMFFNSPTPPVFGVDSGDSGFDFLASFGQQLAPGGTRVINWEWKDDPNTPENEGPPATGVVNTYVYADTQNVYAEANENNNTVGPVTTDLTPPALQSDLVIDSVTASVDGYEVTYTVEIRNQGSGIPGAFDVDIFADSSEEPAVTEGAIASAYTTVATPPGPGESVIVEVLWDEAYAGELESWAVVDAYQQVTETDETNNSNGPVLVTVEAVEGPDLVVTSFEGKVVGGNGILDVTVENKGGGDAGAFTIGLYTQLTGEPTEEDTPDDTIRVSEGLQQELPRPLDSLGKTSQQGLHLFGWKRTRMEKSRSPVTATTSKVRLS